jgi:hypothetical protein
MKAHELLTSAEMWCQESPAKRRARQQAERSHGPGIACALCLRRGTAYVGLVDWNVPYWSKRKTNKEIESLLDEIEAKIRNKLIELANNLDQQQIEKLNMDGVGKTVIQLAIEEIKTEDLAKLSVEELISRLERVLCANKT